MSETNVYIQTKPDRQKGSFVSVTIHTKIGDTDKASILALKKRIELDIATINFTPLNPQPKKGK